MVLHQRNFFLLWLSRLISRLGDWILDVTLPIWVYQLTGSAFALGTIVAIETLPSIVLAPVAGLVTDRYNRKWVAAMANFFLGLSVLLLFLVRSPTYLPLIYLVALINACLGAFLYPAQTSLVPTLVPANQLLQANSILTLTVQGMRLIGPAIGGALIGLTSPIVAVGLDALSFFMAAILVALLRLEHSTEPSMSTQGGEGYRGMWEGLSVIASSPILRTTLSVWSVMMLAAGVVATVMVIFVREVLGGSEASYGYLLAAQGLGMLVGGLGTLTLGRRVRPTTLFVAGLLAFGVIFLLGANAPNLATAMGLVCGLGVTMAVVAISDETIFQEATPDRVRGRVLSTNSALSAAMVLAGAIVAGTLTDVLGVRVVLNGAAIVSILAGLLALPLWQVQLKEPEGTPQPV